MGISWQEMKLMTIFRLDSIIYGVLIAFLYFRKGQLLDRLKDRMAAGGILFLFIIVFVQVKYIVVADAKEIAGILTLSVSALAFAMMLPFLKNLSWNPEGLFGTMVRGVSLISYSLYLNHLFIAMLMGKYLIVSNLIHGIGAFCMYLFVCIFLSTVQYKYWEKYFLKIRDNGPLNS